jgi:hypothetical protein
VAPLLCEEGMRKILLLALAGLSAGVGLGLLIGWVLWPVQYTHTAPPQLRQDYRDDYVLMVAAAYQVEGDLGSARVRLAELDGTAPARPVVELAERWIAEGGRSGDILLLARLADALEAATPAMAPYLEAEP